MGSTTKVSVLAGSVLASVWTTALAAAAQGRDDATYPVVRPDTATAPPVAGGGPGVEGGVTVADSAPSAPSGFAGLPFTGLELLVLVVVAVALIIVGAAVLQWRRRQSA